MSLIHTSLQTQRERLTAVLGRLERLTFGLSNADLTTTLADLRQRVYDPFLFVIVGEVKAGKSSFINALLDTGGREICKVAPQPMTDTIQQITYGPNEHTEVVSQYLKRIYLPLEALKDIAIVDTPGTNTIVAHHQEVTERFIPAADLVVFVFESKNPYRQSSWDFFDFIHSQWHRKVIFVLQQKDLLPPEDLEVNRKGLHDYAYKKGVMHPQIFAVSAKNELEGHYDQSGFSAIRDYIKTHVTGGKATALKLGNLAQTGLNIIERIEAGLNQRSRQWQTDVAFRNDIRQTLDDQELRSRKEVELLLDNILAVYDRHTAHTERELQDGLNVVTLLRRSISSLWSSENSPKTWLEGLHKELDTNLNRDLPTRLQESVVQLSDSIQQMARLVELKVRQSSTSLHSEQDIFSDIAERRSRVLKELQETFAEFLNRSENFTDEQLFAAKSRIAPQIATGSGMAIIGVVLTALTHGSLLDVTGGILTGVGLLFTGVTVALSRNKLIQGYRSEINRGRERLSSEVTEKLYRYINHIKMRIDHNFSAFDQLIANEEAQIAAIAQELNDCKRALSDISQGEA